MVVEYTPIPPSAHPAHIIHYQTHADIDDNDDASRYLSNSAAEWRCPGQQLWQHGWNTVSCTQWLKVHADLPSLVPVSFLRQQKV